MDNKKGSGSPDPILVVVMVAPLQSHDREDNNLFYFNWITNYQHNVYIPLKHSGNIGFIIRLVIPIPLFYYIISHGISHKLTE
jgi:hypothetical protein